jgi:predicted DNA-binding protein YlxM (UPF0122 family)
MAKRRPRIDNLPAEIQNLLPDKPRGKIDLEKALKLRLVNNNTLQEIADVFGVSRQSIHEALQPYVGNSEINLKTWKDNRADILAVHQSRVLSSLTDSDLEKASARDKAIVFGTLYDKERLERGQSTSNQSVFFHIVQESDQAEE